MKFLLTCVVAILLLMYLTRDRPLEANDLLGTYEGEVPVGHAVLDLLPDHTWRYRILGRAEFERIGPWSFEPASSDPDGPVLALSGFVFGFKTFDDDPSVPGIWMPRFSRPFYGPVRTCIRSDSMCLSKRE